MPNIWNLDRLLVMSKALWQSDLSIGAVRQKFDELGMTFYHPWEEFRKTITSPDEWEQSVKNTNAIYKAIFSLVHGISVWNGIEGKPSSPDLNDALSYLKENKSISPAEKEFKNSFRK